MNYNEQLQPMNRYPTPGYPTQKDVERMPNLLHALPARWGAKPAVCMALMLTLTSGMASCARPGTSDNPADLSTLSIPLFLHGEGTGSYGCVSVAPPVFLSEEEAKQVIQDEVSDYGIHFNETREIESDALPATSLFVFPDQEMNATRSGTLKLDGYDPAFNLGFEFVSQADVWDWRVAPSGSSVETYDMKGTAERLAEVVPGTAVFYDPGADFEAYAAYNTSSEERLADAQTGFHDYIAFQKERMLEDLRQQVRDFLAWLSAEGVI